MRERLGVAVAVMLLTACWSAQPEAEPSRKVVRDASVTQRTLDRKAVDRVEIDATFFQPFFLSSGAPDELRAAYSSFQLNKTHEARLALEAFREKHPGHPMAPRATFMLAYIEDSAGGDREKVAAALYEEAASTYPELADYARYYGARSAYEAEDWARTERLCRAIGMGSRFGPRSKHLRGEALLAKGDRAKAIEVLEEVVRDYRRSSWVTRAELDLARAYEQAGRHKDAGAIYQRLRMRYPGSSVEARAEEGVKRVQAKLPAAKAKALFEPSAADRVLRAQALYDRHRSKTVVKEMTELRGAVADKEGSKTWCDTTYLIARANSKLREHHEAAAHYLQFIERCRKDKRVIKALYAGGRSLWNVDEDVRAVELFQTIWRDYPNHSYADDAVLYAARIHRSNGQEEEYRRLLAYQIETFPRGDMLADAHWHRFSSFYRGEEFSKAISYADEVGKNTGESDLYTRGRMAYFKARSLEQLGRRDQAIEGFVKVSRDVPMSYYALLALNRLRELDAGRFATEIASLSRDDGARARWTLDPPQLAEDSGFKRGVELLRLGLFDEAREEFDALKNRYPKGEGLLWIFALLFDRAGAYHLSHNIPRRQIASFGSSYPVGTARDLYELAYPRPFHDKVSRWANKRKLPEALVYAIMREESGFNPRIESWANACGLMQLMVPTARDMARSDSVTRPRNIHCKHLFDPDLNIRLGTRFLEALFNDFTQHPSVAIAGYNGGHGNINRWLRQRGELPFDLWVEEIPFGQTRGYTKRVTMSLWIYQWLYGGDARNPADRLVAIPMKLPGPSR